MTFQLGRRQFLYLTGGATAASVLGACSSPGEAPTGPSSSGALTGPITFWSGYSVTDPNDKSKKPEQFWVYQAAERFRQQTGVEVKIEQLPGDPTMYTKIRTAAIGGNGPDVASVWSGTYMLSIKTFLQPTRQYFTDQEMAQLSGWPAVTDGFDPNQGDKILGVPNGTDGAQVLMFDKSVLEKAGVDPSRWPGTFEDWLVDLDKIKTSGVTPLSLSKPAIVFGLFNTWLAQAVGGAVGVGQLNSGERQFSSPELLDVTTKLLSLRDYALPGAGSTEDGQALAAMFSGKGAMAVGGGGYIVQTREKFKDNASVAKLPNISASGIQGGTIGGTGVAWIVTKNSKHKPAAIAFIKHMLSADEQTKLAQSKESGPLVGRTDLKDVYSDPLVNQVQQWGVESSNTFWPDNTMSADLVNELAAQGQLAWSGDISAEEFLSRLDKKRDSLKK